MTESKPEILAPAGSRAGFVAAMAAGADAIYCGLKQFSARMAAENFTMEELAALVAAAHARNTKVYVTLNSLVKPDELNEAGRLVDQLNRYVRPDGLIVQDLALLSLAAQTGFSGEIHLSTLANVSFAAAMKLVRFFPQVRRVVLPRELSVDEIKQMAAACPKGLSLEVFVHGALCYGVSGRCYWSSYLGGKSGLRGRCVQPCRRIYNQEGSRARFFSCQDLWVDVLTKVLMGVPKLAAMKIEGRKKGPHYVFYTTRAYKMLRDSPGDSAVKKEALACLDYALGRKGTHYNFLSQRRWNPVDVDTHTGSGQLVGKIQGPKAKPYMEPREKLFAGDLLRIGYEDESWHRTYRVSKSVPKKGRLHLNLSEKERPQNGTPVFLIDRREPELAKLMDEIEQAVQQKTVKSVQPSKFRPGMPARAMARFRPFEMQVRRQPQQPKNANDYNGAWLSRDTDPAASTVTDHLWWWLPPVLWPDNEAEIKAAVDRALKKGFKHFVINAPWQMIFFPPAKRAVVWAGPFCNAANELAIENLAALGCDGVIVSPELGRNGYNRLPAKSPLPLGLVVYGNWPLCISRTVAEPLAQDRLFKSPRGEQAWVHQFDDDYWVFPDWAVDLRSQSETLKKLGYRLFVHLFESLPAGVKLKKRPGKWNWDLGLK